MTYRRCDWQVRSKGLAYLIKPMEGITQEMLNSWYKHKSNKEREMEKLEWHETLAEEDNEENNE